MIEHFQNSLDDMDDLLNHLPKNYCILEERVDLETQMAYFEALKKSKKETLTDDEVAILIATLNTEKTSENVKRETLLKLAGVEKVTAYRAIENCYNSLESGDLKSWAAMAIQESRMLIQSQLMDEQQVFIASGLGGKAQKLRYFAVAIMEDIAPIPIASQNIIKQEFQYELENNQSELEQISFTDRYALMTVLVPLENDLKLMFKPAIKECANLGIRVNKNMLLTNVKEFSVEEIETFLEELTEEKENTDE